MIFMYLYYNMFVNLLPFDLFQEKHSTAESVVLRTLELASSGKYRCEVSAEAPSFQTVTNHSSMLTVGKYLLNFVSKHYTYVYIR